MRRTRSRSTARRVVVGCVGTVVALAWFVWLRPASLGGTTTYVVVDGTSMQPTYRNGDLVLMRARDHYEVGDVVAFRVEGRDGGHALVIHRIVGGDAEKGFDTQGDNRPRVDPWHPTPDEIVGETQLHVPKLGGFGSQLARPEVLAALGGAAAFAGITQRRRRRRYTPGFGVRQNSGSGPGSGPGSGRGSGSSSSDRDVEPPAPVRQEAKVESRAAKFTQPRWAFVGLVVAAVLLVPTLALGWSALQASDVTGTRESLGTVRSEVDVDYVARAPKSRVYPTGVVKTERTPAGAVLPANPLYVELVRSIDVTADFDAVMTGAARDGAQPAYTVDVRVSTPEGWTERLDSVGPKKFEDSTRETIKLNIPAIRTRVAEVGRLTGVGGDQFTITVTPGLRVTGETEAGRIRERVAPRLEFTANGEVIKAEPFVKTATEKDLSRTNLRPARFSIGVADLDVAQARALLGGLALLLVAAIAVFAAVLFGGVGLQGADRIAARYRSQVVDVAAVAAPPGPVVLVSSIDELARIARSEQSVILHENLGDGTHRYRVFLGAVTYEFQTVPEHAGHASSRSSTDREET